MNDKKASKFIAPQKVSSDTDPGEEEIDFERRKEIIDKEIANVLGRSIREEYFEKVRLKNVKFAHKKVRERIAKQSRHKNKIKG